MAKSRRPSNRADYENKVNQATNRGTDRADLDVENELDGLKIVMGDCIKRIHQNIQDEDLNVTGSINDIQLAETENGGVAITAPIHLEFLDKGVSGTVTKYDTPYSYGDKMPPPKVFEDWIRRRQINTVNNEQFSGEAQDFQSADDEKKIKSMAFAMAKNKQKHGQAPTNVYSREIPQLVEDAKQFLVDFTLKSITETFKEANDNNS
jgi:hypothetical protein